MALGFILFALFCIFIVVVSILAVLILLLSGRFLLKYRKLHKDSKKTIPFIFSIIGIIIGICLVIFLVNGIRFFTGDLSKKSTEVLFKTNSGINEITDILKIEQYISSFGSKIKIGFFKIYEVLYPNVYFMEFSDISEDIKRIKFNSISLILNDKNHDITNTDNFKDYSDIRFYFKDDSDYFSNKNIEMRKVFNENREVVCNGSLYDEIKGFKFSYRLDFDYESVESITIIYDIDIQLGNGEIVNIEETSIYSKEIINNNG
jgi:hypothetical protein